MWQLPRSRVSRVARGLSCVVVVAVHACDRHPTEPSLPSGFEVNDRFARSAHDGPRPSQNFGPDTYRVGLFTGAGTTKPGLSCDKTAADVRTCSGYLASAVDGALLEVAVEIPLKIDKPVPLVALIHGYAGSKGGSG